MLVVIADVELTSSTEDEFRPTDTVTVDRSNMVEDNTELRGYSAFVVEMDDNNVKIKLAMIDARNVLTIFFLVTVTFDIPEVLKVLYLILCSITHSVFLNNRCRRRQNVLGL